MFKKNSLQYQLFKSLNRKAGTFLFALINSILLSYKIQIILVLNKIKINKNKISIKVYQKTCQSLKYKVGIIKYIDQYQ
jgi:hypothetical protein